MLTANSPHLLVCSAHTHCSGLLLPHLGLGPRHGVLQRLERLPELGDVLEEMGDQTELQQGRLHVVLADRLAQLSALKWVN